MTKLFLHIAVLAVALASPFSSYGQREYNPAVTILEPDRAYELLRDNNTQDLVILDIRTPGEFKTGHLKGAINIMARLGFRRFIEIAGDIEAWKAPGPPLVKKK